MSHLLKCLDRDDNLVHEGMGPAARERIIVDPRTGVHRRFRAERVEYASEERNAEGDLPVAFIVYRELQS